MDCTGQGNDIELIPTVKMEIRHPAKRSFGSEFLSICNHCSYGNLKSKTWKKVPTFCVFFGQNDPLRSNFQNSVPKGFTVLRVLQILSDSVHFPQSYIRICKHRPSTLKVNAISSSQIIKDIKSTHKDRKKVNEFFSGKDGLAQVVLDKGPLNGLAGTSHQCPDAMLLMS